jgi:hypothetical protein
MAELYKKMIDEAMATQRADVGMVKKKRGQAFVIDDAKAYLDAVNQMKPVGDQSKAVFQLHTESVKAHFESLEGLTKTVHLQRSWISATATASGKRRSEHFLLGSEKV